VRYYCKNCKAETAATKQPEHGYKYHCPICLCPIDWDKAAIPDYETPEQYERRTGKALPYDAAVWWKYAGTQKKWRIIHLHSANKYKTEGELLIVCAQSPEPPPADWRPS